MKNRQAIIQEFGDPSVIEIMESPLPEPKEGEVRVQIEASTVSSTDIFIRKGIYPLLKQKPPFVMGYDFVGIVDNVHSEVTVLKLGQRVCGIVMTGGNSEFTCINVNELTKLPDDIDPLQAACLTLSGITAYQMFMHYGKVKRGERILIHGGSGAIGDTLLQLGKLFNCSMVTTASRSKHAYIKNNYGALTLDYHDHDYFDNLDLVATEGFDVVFDFTNQKSFNHSFRYLRKGGRLITYAVFSSSLSIRKKTIVNFLFFGMDFGLMMLKLLFWNALFKNKTAAFYGVLDSKKEFPARHAQDWKQLIVLLQEEKLKPLIHSVLPITGVEKAHELLQNGEVHGQVVIETFASSSTAT